MTIGTDTFTCKSNEQQFVICVLNKHQHITVSRARRLFVCLYVSTHETDKYN